MICMELNNNNNNSVDVQLINVDVWLISSGLAKENNFFHNIRGITEREVHFTENIC